MHSGKEGSCKLLFISRVLLCDIVCKGQMTTLGPASQSDISLVRVEARDGHIAVPGLELDQETLQSGKWRLLRLVLFMENPGTDMSTRGPKTILASCRVSTANKCLKIVRGCQVRES